MRETRHTLGQAGETLAAWFLSGHGLEIVASNVEIGGGEIDLLARDGRSRVVVEVRTTTARMDPVNSIDEPKRARVARLGRRVGATRVDFVGLRLDRDGVDFHWVPGSD